MTNHARNDREEAWEPVGTHTICFSPPDVIMFRANGVLSVDDALLFKRKLLLWQRPEKGFFYISNLSNLTRQSQQVVKEMKDVPPDIFRATAVVTGTFQQKVMLDLVMRVAKFLRVSLTPIPPRLFESEAEALAWFDELRKESS